jgi:guanylate kinase
MTGRLIIISSPSGGGKGTLIREVRAMMPELGFSVSHTTRAQRNGEQEGREYFFVTRDDFERRIETGEFLEYADVHGNLYGTSIAESEKAASTGKDLIVEIDVQGAVQIMDKLRDSVVSIFILPPSFEVLKARLTARGTESGAALNIRLKNAFDEVLQYSRFKYVVINEDVSTASRQIACIITAERQMLDRQTIAIQAILDSFDVWKHRFEGE